MPTAGKALIRDRDQWGRIVGVPSAGGVTCSDPTNKAPPGAFAPPSRRSPFTPLVPRFVAHERPTIGSDEAPDHKAFSTKQPRAFARELGVARSR